ncbi:type III secretion system stator protein SctL [Paraburkholderia flava]|uniref:type III secretion system stator protein SctL n=1 Tax=Paraburkholderia flava TaxID=2547393 RepID=UPI001060B5A6|nr:type III secretion system stator protein SctL [Paraburkholderia flava]
MVIWLRNPNAHGESQGQGVGVNDDIVRAEDLATLVELDAAYADLSRRSEAMLADARAQAQAILDAAEAQADERMAQAQEIYNGAAQQGYEAGHEQALADWHERSLRMLAEGPSIGERQRDRLAQLVALGVEQIVATADPAALFRQAAQTIDRIVADGSPVKVSVHPDDYTTAAAAFDAVAREWRETGRSVSVQVSTDARHERGTCVCETDLGAVDASLPQQLAAIRAALSRAIESMPVEEFETAPQDESAAAYADADDADTQAEADAYGDVNDAQPEQQRVDPHNGHDAAMLEPTLEPDLEEQDFFADAVASVEHAHEGHDIHDAHEPAVEYAAAEPDLA